MTQSEAAPVSVAAQRGTRTGRGAWLVLAAVLPGLFMNVFDFFAIPVLHRDLGSGPPALELIVGGLVSPGFFAAAGAGHPDGYVAGFRVACACDVALALGTLTLTRFLAPRGDRSGPLRRRAVAEPFDDHPD